MRRLYNEPLIKHTTFRIGGPASELVIPETEEELIQEIKRCKQNKIPFRIMGKGSNLLITDKGIRSVIIKNTRACNCIKKNNNCVYVGSSVSLQEFVHFCVNNDLEGMEYLYSIPGTIGGAIFMNAGRGRTEHQTISNKIDFVRYFNGAEVKDLENTKCRFGYRESIFQGHRSMIILGANFVLKDQPRETGEKKIRERMELVKKTQHRRYPNAGSIFKKSSPISRFLSQGIKFGGAKMEKNWINNVGNATFKDVYTLIKISTIINYLFLNKPELEIEIWK